VGVAIAVTVLDSKAAVEYLTEIADAMLLSGVSDVYELTYEAVESSAVRWEYQGLDGVVSERAIFMILLEHYWSIHDMQ
jgi:hypothetical protein